MMSDKKKKMTYEELIDKISNLKEVSVKKVDSVLTSFYTQIVDDVQFETIWNLLKQKLEGLMIDYYLKIVHRFTQSQMKRDNKLLINRMYKPVKENVRNTLDILDMDITHKLDLFSENREGVKAWILQGKERDKILWRAKLSYIYILLKMDKKSIPEIELLVISTMESDQKLSFNKKIGKFVPEILLSKNPFSCLEKLAYFHYKDAETLKSVNEQLSNIETRFNTVVSENSELSGEIELLKNDRNNNVKMIDNLNKQIDELNKKLKASEDKLAYETHRYAEDNRAFMTSHAEKLSKRLAIEIEGINSTLEYVKEPEKGKIQRRISNIEGVLKNKEEI